MASNKQNKQSERPGGCLGFCLGLVFDDWVRKLVALGLGIVCWFGIRSTLKGSVAGQQWFTVENVYVDIPSSGEGYYFAHDSGKLGPVSLDVSVDFMHQGMELTASDFPMEIKLESLPFDDDVKRTEPLSFDYHLSVDDIRGKPAVVGIRKFTPSVVEVRWDRFVSRDIPVRVNYRNWLPSDQTVSVKIDPAVIRVTGPAFKVNQLDEIQTVDFDVRSDAMDFDSELELVQPNVTDCTLSQKSVKLKVDIRRNSEIIRRRVENVRVNILHRMDATLQVDRSNLDSDHVAVILSGTAERVNRLEERGVSAFCDLTGFSTPGVQNVRIQILDLPPGITAAIEPSEFKRLKLVPLDSGKPTSEEAEQPADVFAENGSAAESEAARN